MNNDKAWIQKLKSGDKVILDTGSRWRLGWEVVEVKKITPTGIVKVTDPQHPEDTRDFDKHGWERGGARSGGHRAQIIECTDERVLEIRRQWIIAEVSRLNKPEVLATLNVDELETILPTFLVARDRRLQVEGEEKAAREAREARRV